MAWCGSVEAAEMNAHFELQNAMRVRYAVIYAIAVMPSKEALNDVGAWALAQGMYSMCSWVSEARSE